MPLTHHTMKEPEENQDQSSQNKEKNSEDQSDNQPHPSGEEAIDLSSINIDNLPPHADAAIPPGYEVESVLYARSGPLPPPVELAAYERVLPGLANRIVAMTETVGRPNRILSVCVFMPWFGNIPCLTR